MSEAVPAPSATVVLLRPGPEAPEILLLRRNSKLAFHGGAWVFPGGRVDPGEGGGEIGARIAAVREAREEAGLALDPATLVPLSHWTTPEGQPRRFSTWFYVASLAHVDVHIDGGEIHEHRWFTADAALDAQRSGEIELPPPTFVTLCALGRHRSIEATLDAASRAQPTVYVPRIVRGREGTASLYPGDAGWESRDADAAGARHRLEFLDSGWRYLREE